jgi:hypothetical protein
VRARWSSHLMVASCKVVRNMVGTDFLCRRHIVMWNLGSAGLAGRRS